MNNNTINQSIAIKLALHAAALLVAAFLLLLAGVFFSFRHLVRLDGENLAKSLAAIYSDFSVYEARKDNLPIDISYNEKLSFFGEYMCTWYRVACVFTYVPDLANGTICYLSTTNKDLDNGTISKEHNVGVVEKYVLSDEEMKVWRGEEVFSVEQNPAFKNGLFVTILTTDDFGNRTMFGVAVSLTDLMAESFHGFLDMGLFLLLIIVVLAISLFLFMRRMVSRPAQAISAKMSDYISEGKRSPVKIEVRGNDEFSLIAGAFNHMTEEIDKYIGDLATLSREQERRQAEFDIASKIQKGILTPPDALVNNCRIKALMDPAKDVGGDLYDYLPLDNSRTMVVIADVSGKGVPSAMLMALVLTLIRQFARLGYSPAGLLQKVNETFSKENPQLMFVTAFVAIYDSDTGLLTYANAGHNNPYLIHHAPLLLDQSQGTPLGLFQDETYNDAVLRLEQGDALFLYTDGVNEAVNSSKQFYGTDRLERVLQQAAASPDSHFVQAVNASVRDFVGEAVQNDDITMLCLYAQPTPDLRLHYDIRQFSAIRERILSASLPRPMLMDLCVAAEECFVNICSYAFDTTPPPDEKILFHFEYSDKVVMRFSDGGKPFDPRNNLPDTDLYDIDTAVGGLGRLIAFTIADFVDYEYTNGRNILTITKNIKN